ncbi:hypothetical protein L1987_78172 [Smallanthus sonchifolius]|uniref:Uncharacterized protein n=1 Tax=Smallanthus sonchifolius TaxID=185202 RepID=A0ACB8ZC59_9ASTR|nr:hypothetical protein L1987_78172 [Smallanthus sonchifolius]
MHTKHYLGAYKLEGLVARLSSSGSFIYKALKCKEPTGDEPFSYMFLLYEASIAKATKNEDRIHIIDFQNAHGGQWVTLIQALAARPGGPPNLRITGIDDSRNAFARSAGLSIVGQRLTKLAELCNVRFEFHGVPVSGSDIETQNLRVLPANVNTAKFFHRFQEAFSYYSAMFESIDATLPRDDKA